MENKDNSSSFEKQYRKINYKKKYVFSFIKRLVDIVASSLGIIILSPLIIILCFLVKVTSRGPIFYVSDRVGKNNKNFKMIKFRSMRINAEKELDSLLTKNETGGITFKMENDPRVTNFGKFLRKTSLDELPQLFNIFIGTMTIIGPRPATPREVALYNDYQKQRLLVKQGLTCIWQVSGRSNTTFDEQIEMDLDYIERRNTWLDFVILVKTIPAVLFSKGAK